MNIKSFNTTKFTSTKQAFLRLLPSQFLISLNYFLPYFISTLLAGNFVSSAGLAAISYSEILNYCLCSFAGIIGCGCSVLLGKSTGSGNTKATNIVFSTSIIFSSFLGILFTLLIIVNQDLISQLLQMDSQTTIEFKSFINGWCFTCIPTIVLFVLLTFLQTFSQQNGIYIFMVIFVVLNLFLGIYFAYYLNMGSFGVGLSSSISMLISDFFLLAWLSLKCKNIVFKFSSFSLKVIKDTFVIGSPFALSNACLAIKAVIINMVANSLGGVDAVAAISITKSIVSFPTSFALAISDSIILVASIYIGEQNKSKLYDLLSYAFKFSLVFLFLCSVVWVLSSYWFCSLFTNDQNVLDLAFRFALFYTPDVFLFVFAETLTKLYQSMNKIIMSHIFYCLYCFIIPVAILFVAIPFLGLDAVWISYSLAAIIFLILFLIILTVKVKRFPKLPDDLLIFCKNLFKGEPCYCEAHNVNEVIKCSKKINEFLLNKDLNATTVNLTSLACEEIGVDVFANNCSEKRQNKCVVEYSVILDENKITLQITDNSDLFSPKIYEKIATTESLVFHFGIKTLLKICDDIVYQNVASLNTYHISFPIKYHK